MTSSARQLVFCSGAPKSSIRARKGDKTVLCLDYKPEGPVRLKLPTFIRSVGALPDRVLDLLEIAAYVFSADRLADRGRKDQLNYESWARDFHFCIKVRDVCFWNDALTKEKINELLKFITGDRDYVFAFLGGHDTDPTHLFDSAEFILEPEKTHHVMLFSGGLDSLAGALLHLTTSNDVVCLVSHRSGQPSIVRTQNKLVEALSAKFPGRVKHYHFECGLTNIAGRAVEETQRTRTFVYGAMAFALAVGLAQRKITFYENGITSLNFSRREDAINARASRTTHPKSMQLLGHLLEHVLDETFTVENKFRWKTKAEVLDVIKECDAIDFISSAVTCSKTTMAHQGHTHCGGCFQCVDRRFAISARSLFDSDPSSGYALNFLTEPIEDSENRTATIDYVRLGLDFSKQSMDAFYDEHLAEIEDVIGSTDSEIEIVQKLSNLVERFGRDTVRALHEFQQLADLTKPHVLNSLLDIIARQEYLRPSNKRFVDCVCARMQEGIPTMFAKNSPADENDFNDKVHALIKSRDAEYRREFPVVNFALSRVIPDHEFRKYDVLIESKYVRGKTSPSKISDQIGADLIKYPASAFIVFVIYDPERQIKDDMEFAADFESLRACRILIIR